MFSSKWKIQVVILIGKAIWGSKRCWRSWPNLPSREL